MDGMPGQWVGSTPRATECSVQRFGWGYQKTRDGVSSLERASLKGQFLRLSGRKPASSSNRCSMHFAQLVQNCI